ncbi:MAG: alpha-amylase family glycosyl hydrolase [Bacteroidota bacterium]|nr:alpha-amylase family glycosyl hydrolase [Bacteroidota bacterium]
MDPVFQSLPWSADSNIYEVNLRQYTPEGTFRAFENHLPRLRDMGIEILWFMPITPISQKGRLGSLGSYYACSDYCKTNPEFGSPDDFKSLVQKAHRLGFKVLIDWVANHTGLDHRWTTEHPEFYRKDKDGHFFDAHGWEDVIDLNYDLPSLRQTMIQCMKFWLDNFDIDGFRCDMAMLVPLDFWKEARIFLDKQKPLYWLAECEDVAYHAVFDSSYTWKFLHAMEDYVKGNSGTDGLYQVLQFYNDQFPRDAMRAFFTSNHDENSHSGSEYERLGNAAIPFAVFCCTWNGIPLIYSGQELPNTKRLKFFDKDLIDWKTPCALHDFYKTLLRARKENAALRSGDSSVSTFIVQNSAGRQVISFLRRRQANEVLVILNLSETDVSLTLSSAEVSGSFTDLFTQESMTISQDSGFALKPWDYRVYTRN